MRDLIALMLVLAACGTPAGGQPGADAPPGSGADAPAGDAAVANPQDPANDGPHAVSTTDVSIPGRGPNRTLATTIYVPDGVSPAPLVVISPGFQMTRSQYASYAHHLATWGFVAILTDYADGSFFADHQKLADDVGAVIDYALAPAFVPAIDGAKIALAGHSLGGDISVLAATGDARVKAVVGWDPVDASPSVVPEKMSSLTAALAVIGETTDASGGFMPCAPAADNFQQFYAAAPAPALQMTVATADHMDWVDDPTCTYCSVCTAGTAPAELARAATRRLDVAWLRTRLLGDAAMADWLAHPPEVNAGTATIVSK